MAHVRIGSTARGTLHPHSTTHSSLGTALPNLTRKGGFLGAHENLCFDLKSFAPRHPTSGEPIPFDPSEFVSQTLTHTNPAFQITDTEGEEEKEKKAQEDDSALMPAHTTSPSVPLELLREHLTSYQLFIKNELIELLNTEYTDFIGLSTSLTGIDTRIQAIQASLHEQAKEIETLRSKIDAETLEPLKQKLQQFYDEKHKQSLIQMIIYIMDQMKKNDAQLKANEEEGVGNEAINSPKNKKDAMQSTTLPTTALDGTLLSTSHANLISHHLTTAQVNQHQRANEAKKHRHGQPVRRTNYSTNSYDGLKIDIPVWMLNQGHHSSHHQLDDSDDDDNDDDEDNEIDSSESDLNQNDAFGLYSALLNVPTTATMYQQSLQHPSSSNSTTSLPSPSLNLDSIASLTSTLIRLERVSHSLASLSPLITICSQFHLIRDLRHVDGVSGPFNQLSKRCQQQARETWIQLLQLLSAPIPPDSSIQRQLYGLTRTSLRIFTFLDLRPLAEELVREYLVLPVLKDTIQPSILRAEHLVDEREYWIAKSKNDTITTMYQQLFTLLNGPFKILLDSCTNHYPLLDSSPVPSAIAFTRLPFNFLTTSFLNEFVSYVSSQEIQSLLFSTGLPHIFIGHFKPTQDFLQQLSSFARRYDLLNELHAHPAWATFQKKWNLNIYFQLRFQKIAGGLETSLTTVVTNWNAVMAEIIKANSDTKLVKHTPTGSTTSSFYLPFMCDLSNSIWSCFNDHTFITELAHRFIKLSLQCLIRGINITEDLLKQSNSTATPIMLLLYSDWNTLFTSHRELIVLIGKKFNITINPDHLLNNLTSTAIIDQKVHHDGGDASIVHALFSALLPVFHRSQVLLDSILTRLVDLVLIQSREPLQCVPRIAAAYRGTKRKVPSHPFRYVSVMLKPLLTHLTALERNEIKGLIGEVQSMTDSSEWLSDDTDSSAPILQPSQSHFLDQPSRNTFMLLVLQRLTQEYDTKVKGCLSDASQVAELLQESKRLVGKSTTPGTSPTTTDATAAESDRIRQQLELDCQHYAACVRAIAPTKAEQILTDLLRTIA